jgi:putative transposase
MMSNASKEKYKKPEWDHLGALFCRFTVGRDAVPSYISPSLNDYMDKSNIFYHRHLPHFQPTETAFHVVFRLNGSLPKELITEMKKAHEKSMKSISEITDKTMKTNKWKAHQEEYFDKFNDLLDGSCTGPHWLSEPAVTGIVSEAIKYRDGKGYDLFAFCIMPNHVHMVFYVGRLAEPVNPEPGRDIVPSHELTRIIGSLKKYTALQANRILGRSGAFWQDESYDHVIRDDMELKRTILYVINNPVKAGLVRSWERWPWTYCKKQIP